MKTYKQLKKISDEFFGICEQMSDDYPSMVCISMHEYARNLYPADPYIPFSPHACHTERLYQVCKNLIKFMKSAKRLGHYEFVPEFEIVNEEVKKRTGKVYGRLWEKFKHEKEIKDAVNIIKDRFIPNGFDMRYFLGKSAIDVGCGSGRFTFALKKLGCRKVIGVDYGTQGLTISKIALQKLHIKNITFRQANVLRLPFKDGSFDFIFCNGVLHHTEDMEKGIAEVVRLARNGSKIWLYLYGDGGIFWYARKKMPHIMKRIPQEYTIKVLDSLGMPKNRFIFTDNWYVPIERHCTDKEVRKILNNLGVDNIKRIIFGRPTDLDYLSMHGGKEGKIMWGEGELRYFIEKV